MIFAVLALILVLAACTQVVKNPRAPGGNQEKRTPAQVLEEAQQELAMYEQRLPSEKAERLTLLTHTSRLCFLVGDLCSKDKKEHYFNKGRTYAEMLVAERPDWVDGHYWLALNLCGLAEIGPARRGLGLLPQIAQLLEKALAVDPTYDQGGPHRVLGRIYYEAPAWPMSVGDPNKARQHLEAAVRIAPDNSTNHLYLAEALERQGKKAEARRELETVLRSPRHALGPHGLEEDYQEAKRLLGFPVDPPAGKPAGKAEKK
jgi:tetratricopeptide (TPR) repeat protein